jgi:hypothetical protein
MKTPSGTLTIIGIIAGVLSAIEGIVTPGTDVHTAVYGAGGIILGLGAVIGKIFHDKGIHISTIQQAGAVVASSAPALADDLSTVLSSVENDVPALKAAIDSFSARLTALEASKPSSGGRP